MLEPGWRTRRTVWGSIGLLLLLSACGYRPPSVSVAAPSNAGEPPTIFFETFKMNSLKGQVLEWTFTARSAQIYEKSHLAKAQDIHILYWKNGQAQSELTAQQGSVRTDSNDMRAEGHVVVTSTEGAIIRTERLEWDQKQGRLFTDLPVEVDRGQNVLTGIGLQADSNLRNIEILSEVRIKVKSLKELSPRSSAPRPQVTP